MATVVEFPAVPATQLEIARLVEKVHRRFADLLRHELTRLGIHDISPAQAMMLFTIGNDELSVRDLIDRGHYLGSNASYNLKQLLEGGFVDRTASPRDRRAARICLAEKGRKLCDDLRAATDGWQRLFPPDDEEHRDLETTFRTLRRLELAWTQALHYGEG